MKSKVVNRHNNLSVPPAPLPGHVSVLKSLALISSYAEQTIALIVTGLLLCAVRVTSPAEVAGFPTGCLAATSAKAWHDTRLTFTPVALTMDISRPVVGIRKMEPLTGTSRWIKVSDSISNCTRAEATGGAAEGTLGELEQRKAPIGTASSGLESTPPLDFALKLAGVFAVKGFPRRTVPALSLKAWHVAVGSLMVAATPFEAARLFAVEKT